MSKEDLVTKSYTAPRRGLDGRFLGRTRHLFVKVPYSATFALSETLTRAMTTGQVEAFAVDVIPPRQIAAVRAQLVRWDAALDTIKEVDWNR